VEVTAALGLGLLRSSDDALLAAEDDRGTTLSNADPSDPEMGLNAEGLAVDEGDPACCRCCSSYSRACCCLRRSAA